jgi:hypothetical protein
MCGVKVLEEGAKLWVQPFGARERKRGERGRCETRGERRANIFSNLIFIRIVVVEPNPWVMILQI